MEISKETITLKQIRELYKEKRKSLRDAFHTKHKVWFTYLIALLIIALAMNWGALFLTNVMVGRANTGGEYVEMNPVAAKVHGFDTVEEARSIFPMIVIALIGHMVVIAGWLYHYYNTYDTKTYLVLVFFTFMIFYIWGSDFINNFGLYVGELTK